MTGGRDTFRRNIRGRRRGRERELIECLYEVMTLQAGNPRQVRHSEEREQRERQEEGPRPC